MEKRLHCIGVHRSFRAVNRVQPGLGMLERRFLELTLILGFWTIIALSFAGQFFISSSQLGRPVAWHAALAHSLADWYTFALLSYLPIALSRRLGLDGPEWGMRLGVHFLGSVVFSLLFVVLRGGVALLQAHWDGVPLSYGIAFRALLLKTWHFNLLIYWVILAVCHALDYYKRYQERVARTSDLERRLAEARLQALQMQLNPHFLFNTLHAISAVMQKDVDAADRMITRLSELLRHALESTHQQEVPLREELHFLQRYLDIERTRFGERLQVRFMVSPDTDELLVPNLLLQPLVENAIQHGIEPHARVGTIQIRAEKRGGILRLEVSDSGDGVSAEAISDGVGLANTRARLQQLHGDLQSFQLSRGPEGGLQVVITLPAKAVDSPDLKV